MRVSPKVLLRTYANFKEAAINQEEPENPISWGGATEIVEAKVDNDPTTRDSLVATFWDGGMSSPTNLMRFSEYTESDRLVLQYDHSEVGFGATDKTSTIRIDTKSTEILSARDDAGILL